MTEPAPLPSVPLDADIAAAFDAVKAAWGALDAADPEVQAKADAAIELAFRLYEGPSGQSSEGHLIYGSALIACAETAMLGEVDAAVEEAVASYADLAQRLGFAGEATAVLMTLAHRKRRWTGVLTAYQMIPRLTWGDAQHPFWHVERPALQVAEAAIAMKQPGLALAVLREAALQPSRHASKLRAQLALDRTGKGVAVGRPILPGSYADRAALSA